MEIRNRGMKDVLMLVCDGLTALPEAVTAIWPQTVVQTCVVHLIRNSLRYGSRRDTTEIARISSRPIRPSMKCKPGAGCRSSRRSGTVGIHRSAESGNGPGMSSPRPFPG
ncbi:transposase [Streptomyces sp. NPDC056544]|uniref:transposase n=1 Tax=unclassified Streptomyces TaxID=2593676 RepID=UPI003694F536